jgi:hypothetical protein
MIVNHVAEAFAWCILQVTLFSCVATCLYALVDRFRLGGGATVLISSLATDRIENELMHLENAQPVHVGAVASDLNERIVTVIAR